MTLNPGEKNPYFDLIRVAWPLIVSMLAHTIMATADIWYLAKLGQTELAGAGIAMTGTFTVLCFGIGFLGAVRILIAQAEGAGTLDAYANLPWIAVFCALIYGLAPFALRLMLRSSWIGLRRPAKYPPSGPSIFAFACTVRWAFL